MRSRFQKVRAVPDVVCFDKGGRESRRLLIAKGAAPRDFFYGTDLLQQEGLDLGHVNSVANYTGPLAGWHHLRERVAGRLFGLAYRTHLLSRMRNELSLARVALSFTDGFSLTLGNFYRGLHLSAPRLIGCFHCLSDIESKVPPMARGYVASRISAALDRLDIVAFFGPADRDYAIRRYGIPPEKTEIIRFGVDTEFWAPGDHESGDHIFSIGQDPNRDFDTLVKAVTDVSVHIHTSLRISVPRDLGNVVLSSGSYFQSTLSDIEVRDNYRNAMAVVVPLKDVFQPTGYSVTLQAMACGKPVILSNIKGLWAKDLLVDGENCLLVEPGNSRAIANAIDILRSDATFRARIGRAARQTVEAHFSLRVAADSTRSLINRALTIQ